MGKKVAFGAWAVVAQLALVLCPMATLLADNHDDDDETMGWFVPSGTPFKNFYGGVRVGYGNIDYPDSNQDGSVTNVSTDDTDIVSSVMVGYQVNDYVGVQAGFQDFGESDFSGTADGSGESWVAGDVSANLQSDGWEVGVMGRWPINERWAAFGFIGWLWWESTETFDENGFVTVEKDSGSDATVALGVEYDIGMKDRVVYRFSGSHHQVDDTGYDINSAGAEIIYRFP